MSSILKMPFYDIFFLNDAQQIKSYYRHHQNIYDFIYISIVIEISITPVRVHVH